MDMIIKRKVGTLEEQNRPIILEAKKKPNTDAWIQKAVEQAETYIKLLCYRDGMETDLTKCQAHPELLFELPLKGTPALRAK